MSRRRKTSLLGLLLEIIFIFIRLFVSAVVWIAKIIVPIIFKIVFWLIFKLIPSIVYLIWSAVGYSKSDYKAVTNNSIWDTYTDKGKLGEYLIYRHLKNQCGQAKWLFNVYIPRDDGRTTEIDVMMLHPSGVYVFESKNYSGWIFGSYYREEWTQCIKKDENSKVKKYHFYNPIKQNEIHVKYLKPLLSVDEQDAIYPLVVFGNHCKLKQINLSSCSQPVLNLRDLGNTFAPLLSANRLDSSKLLETYQELYQYTQVSAEVKQKHIADIERMKTGKKNDTIVTDESSDLNDDRVIELPKDIVTDTENNIELNTTVLVGEVYELKLDSSEITENVNEDTLDFSAITEK